MRYFLCTLYFYFKSIPYYNVLYHNIIPNLILWNVTPLWPFEGSLQEDLKFYEGISFRQPDNAFLTSVSSWTVGSLIQKVAWILIKLRREFCLRIYSLCRLRWTFLNLPKIESLIRPFILKYDGILSRKKHVIHRSKLYFKTRIYVEFEKRS